MSEFRKGHHLFGMAGMDAAGRITLPEAAREEFNLVPGTSVAILGDERGMAIIRSDRLKQMQDKTGMRAFIEGQFLLGTSDMDDDGRVVLPEAARKNYGLGRGDVVMVIGERTKKGPAILKADINDRIVVLLLDALKLDAKNGGHRRFMGHRGKNNATPHDANDKAN